MVLNHSTLGKQIRPNFLRSISLLYEILPTSLGTCPEEGTPIHYLNGYVPPNGVVILKLLT